MQKVLHNLGGVKCQPFLKSSAYNVADVIHSLVFQFTNVVDKPKFSYSFSVICLPYLFHNLVYQTLHNLKLRGIEFSNGPKDERRKFSNGLTTMVQQEY